MIVYLITLFKILFTIVKLKNLSLKLPKSQRILIFLVLVIVIASITITAFEREESIVVGYMVGCAISRGDYKSITVDEYN
ncbi:hypothetical protein RBH29_14430 [Herbivorax sp. ANBcel31]|uniref:hypothetical protein n=1 Tax=Herbivorax sp. ANBcel31 TaxID=3069754 RepID=UPI0027B334AE|nr:hypothetical protein [Herbivorax sp. ANBcel31]MDQ2087626.1 hypothetical protein [Herbivorax sp. ANBcel31]